MESGMSVGAELFRGRDVGTRATKSRCCRRPYEMPLHRLARLSLERKSHKHAVSFGVYSETVVVRMLATVATLLL